MTFFRAQVPGTTRFLPGSTPDSGSWDERLLVRNEFLSVRHDTVGRARSASGEEIQVWTWRMFSTCARIVIIPEAERTEVDQIGKGGRTALPWATGEVQPSSIPASGRHAERARHAEGRSRGG